MTTISRAVPVEIRPRGEFAAPGLTGLSLQVTDACNLACSYCYFRDKDPISMTTDTVDRALSLLEVDDGGTDWHVNLFGGEPTLKPELIRYICESATARSHGLGKAVTFSMTTNGTRFDTRLLDLTREFRISTMLSMDGNREAHDRFRVYKNGGGSFDQIVANLDRLRTAPAFKVRLTVSPLTVAYLAESVRDLIELGIRTIATSVVVEAEWTAEDIGAFAEQWQRIAAVYVGEYLAGRPLSIKGLNVRETTDPLEICSAPSTFGCGAATTFVFVNALGDIYPCHRYPGYFDKSPDVRIGSVTTGLDEARRLRYVLANRATSKKGCRSFVSSSRESGPCGDCAIQGACGGSCMAVNHYMTGDPTQPPSLPGAIEKIKLAVADQVWDYLSTTPRRDSDDESATTPFEGVGSTHVR